MPKLFPKRLEGTGPKAREDTCCELTRVQQPHCSYVSVYWITCKFTILYDHMIFF